MAARSGARQRMDARPAGDDVQDDQAGKDIGQRQPAPPAARRARAQVTGPAPLASQVILPLRVSDRNRCSISQKQARIIRNHFEESFTVSGEPRTSAATRASTLVRVHRPARYVLPLPHKSSRESRPERRVRVRWAPPATVTQCESLLVLSGRAAKLPAGKAFDAGRPAVVG
jgi:hypothetical protein